MGDDKKVKKKAADDTAVLEKIAAMPEPFRTMGERIHTLILESVPTLQARVWYGMPGYAQNGPVICFFRADDEYMSFGLTEKANHQLEADADDQLMASAWFFTALDEATEARIVAIVQKATH